MMSCRITIINSMSMFRTEGARESVPLPIPDIHDKWQVVAADAFVALWCCIPGASLFATFYMVKHYLTLVTENLACYTVDAIHKSCMTSHTKPLGILVTKTLGILVVENN